MGILTSNIGVTPSRAQAESGEFDALSIPINKPGKYLVRIIGDLNRLVSRFIPTVSIDAETGKSKAGWKVIRGEHLLLDTIESADFQVRKEYFLKVAVHQNQEIDERKIEWQARSRLASSKRWMIAAFDRADGDNPIVKRLAMPWKVWKGVTEKQTMEDPTKPGFLLNGPLYAFDVLINHTRDDDKPGNEAFKHDYSVEVVSRPFQGQFPISFLEEAPTAEVLNACFTPAEMQAMETTTVNLQKETAPHTEDEIRDIFRKYPINLGLMENGTPVFLYPDRLAQTLDDLEIPYVLPGGRVSIPANTGGQAMIENVPAAPKVSSVSVEATDAQVEPVAAPTVPQPPPAPAPAPPPVPAQAPAQGSLNLQRQQEQPPFEVQTPPPAPAPVPEVAPPPAPAPADSPPAPPAPDDGVIPYDDSQGWESEAQRAKVIAAFQPDPTKVHARLFADWKTKYGDLPRFKSYFPGVFEQITSSDGATVTDVTSAAPSAAPQPAPTPEPAPEKKPPAKKGGRRW